jgi:hypothetical protein
MECKKTKKIVSLVLLVAAVLIKFLTTWPVWIPILVLAFAVVGLFCKCKCKKCCDVKEEAPVEATPEVEAELVVAETPAETVAEVEVEKELE